jgi:hypothetical protein
MLAGQARAVCRRVGSECYSAMASGSQWWPDAARTQWSGVAAMRSDARQSPAFEDRSHWTRKVKSLHCCGIRCHSAHSEDEQRRLSSCDSEL